LLAFKAYSDNDYDFTLHSASYLLLDILD